MGDGMAEEGVKLMTEDICEVAKDLINIKEVTKIGLENIDDEIDELNRKENQQKEDNEVSKIELEEMKERLIRMKLGPSESLSDCTVKESDETCRHPDYISEDSGIDYNTNTSEMHDETESPTDEQDDVKDTEPGNEMCYAEKFKYSVDYESKDANDLDDSSGSEEVDNAPLSSDMSYYDPDDDTGSEKDDSVPVSSKTPASELDVGCASNQEDNSPFSSVISASDSDGVTGDKEDENNPSGSDVSASDFDDGSGTKHDDHTPANFDLSATYPDDDDDDYDDNDGGGGSEENMGQIREQHLVPNVVKYTEGGNSVIHCAEKDYNLNEPHCYSNGQHAGIDNSKMLHITRNQQETSYHVLRSENKPRKSRKEQTVGTPEGQGFLKNMETKVEVGRHLNSHRHDEENENLGVHEGRSVKIPNDSESIDDVQKKEESSLKAQLAAKPRDTNVSSSTGIPKPAVHPYGSAARSSPRFRMSKSGKCYENRSYKREEYVPEGQGHVTELSLEYIDFEKELKKLRKKRAKRLAAEAEEMIEMSKRTSREGNHPQQGTQATKTSTTKPENTRHVVSGKHKGDMKPINSDSAESHLEERAKTRPVGQGKQNKGDWRAKPLPSIPRSHVQAENKQRNVDIGTVKKRSSDSHYQHMSKVENREQSKYNKADWRAKPLPSIPRSDVQPENKHHNVDTLGNRGSDSHSRHRPEVENRGQGKYNKGDRNVKPLPSIQKSQKQNKRKDLQKPSKMEPLPPVRETSPRKSPSPIADVTAISTW